MAIAEGSTKGSKGASAAGAANPSAAAKTADVDALAALRKLDQLQVANSTTKRAVAAAPPTPTDVSDAAASASASSRRAVEPSPPVVPRPLTDRERGALDLYVITPRAVPSVALLTEKYESITAFYEKGSQVEAFEKPVDGGLFSNQHGFECEDDCWVTTVKNDNPEKAGYLVTTCNAYYHELRPLLDVYLSMAGKTFHWCDGESSNAASTPSMTVTFTEDGSLKTSSEEEPSTWEVSGPNTVVVHCFAQAHELTLSRFRLEFESRNLEVDDGYVLHRGYLKHG